VIALKWDESKLEIRDEKQAVLCTCIASVAKCSLFRSVQKKQGSRLKCKWADQNIQPCGFRWEAREAFHFRFPLRLFLLPLFHTFELTSFDIIKMESFVVDVAPPLSRLNLTATTEDLHKHPEYFFAVRHSFAFLYTVEC
jgi:hypothetical protein